MLAACAALGLAQTSKPLNPVTWRLEAPATVKPGSPPARLKLTAQIARGWHLYSLKKLEGGPYPTSITVAEGHPFRLAGAVEAPDPIRIEDEAFGMEVEIYIDEAVFNVPVEAVPGAKPGTDKVVVDARYQVCDNKMCLPPRTAHAEAAVEIAKPR
jgi:hypothetical protein